MDGLLPEIYQFRIWLKGTSPMVWRRLLVKANILDAGCGEGRDSKYFLDQGYTVTAFDASREMFKVGERQFWNMTEKTILPYLEDLLEIIKIWMGRRLQAPFCYND